MMNNSGNKANISSGNPNAAGNTNPNTAQQRGNTSRNAARNHNAANKTKANKAAKDFMSTSIGKALLGLAAAGVILGTVNTATNIIDAVSDNKVQNQVEQQAGEIAEIMNHSLEQDAHIAELEVQNNRLMDIAEQYGLDKETNIGRGETENGVKFDYQAGRLIYSNGENIISGHEYNDDLYFNTGFRYDESFSAEEIDGYFDKSVTNVPQILAPNAPEVLTQDQMDAITDKYDDIARIDVDSDNAGDLIQGYLDNSENGGAFQQDLINASVSEGVASMEFITLPDGTEYTILEIRKGKGTEYEDVEAVWTSHDESIPARLVRYENGKEAYYGLCGAAQLIKLKEPTAGTEGSETSEASEGSEGNENIGTGSEGSEGNENIDTGSEGSEDNENIDTGSEGSEGSEDSEDSEGSEGNEDAKDPNAIEQNMGIGDESSNNLSQLPTTERTPIPTIQDHHNVDTSDSAGAEAQEKADDAAAAAGETPIYSDDELANMWANFNNNNK
jgi:hypothetical protein